VGRSLPAAALGQAAQPGVLVAHHELAGVERRRCHALLRPQIGAGRRHRGTPPKQPEQHGQDQ